MVSMDRGLVLCSRGQLELYFLFLSMILDCVWCIISKPAVQCCGVCLSKYNIVYEHDGVNKIRADVLHVCTLAAMFDDRTYKESKGAS